MEKMDDEHGTMRALRELDEITDWELSGDLLAVNDEEEGGDSSVAVMPPPGGGSGPSDGEELGDMLSCVHDMAENGDVEDILIIVNMVGDDQVVFTTVQRNDLVVGMLETAKMNWYSTQVEMQNYEDEEVEEDG